MVKISVLICSFAESKYLKATVDSIKSVFPHDKFEMQILVDIEQKQTGLQNTANRYMNLFREATGEIILKSDDDVHYYPGAFEKCIEVLENVPGVGYVSPISHYLMKEIGVKHASSDRMPIEPDGHRCDAILSGMAWFFKPKLWARYPYSRVRTWQLDTSYANFIHSIRLKTIALNGALIRHLGQDRYKGTSTDRPGKIATSEFKRNHAKENFTIF